MNEIWDDPMVKEALRSGRRAGDIQIHICPDCNCYGYYNEGSTFYCRHCEILYSTSNVDLFFDQRTLEDICEEEAGP
jgi:hypothetical protein